MGSKLDYLYQVFPYFRLPPRYMFSSPSAIRPNSILLQVQLRFCPLDPSAEQGDEFPPSICVQINGKMCPLPNPIPTNKPNVEPKRPPRQDFVNICMWVIATFTLELKCCNSFVFQANQYHPTVQAFPNPGKHSQCEVGSRLW